VYKIEKSFFNDVEEDCRVASSDQQMNQMLMSINEIKEMLSERPIDNGIPDKILEQFREDMSEAAKIKRDLDVIQEAIDRTKIEIAALHLPGDNAQDISRMSDELGAIVNGTESATEGILAAVEKIDEDATDLNAALTDASLKNLSSDIQDQVVKIYEACNFQDLTGQRISKVIRTFSFIERRVDEMMEIWGGIDSFKGFEPAPVAECPKGGHLLNGPSLHDEEDVASQDDIDALFD
jgi:chemotaxis protein CheZ